MAKHQYLYFYPRSPCGERLLSAVLTAPSTLFLSTLSLRRATLFKNHIFRHHSLFLSTLSLRRATAGFHQSRKGRPHFYPRSPCGERPGGQSCSSTLVHFYPRSPCGERHYFSAVMRQNPGISIHALLAESDIISQANGSATVPFLSTLSLRRATVAASTSDVSESISIHALLAESDGNTSLQT